MRKVCRLFFVVVLLAFLYVTATTPSQRGQVWEAVRRGEGRVLVQVAKKIWRDRANEYQVCCMLKCAWLVVALVANRF